jgi:tetratricopeptide (TPR) repeat protein/predicted aspartyl protease
MATVHAADGCKLLMTPAIPVRILGLRAVITANINGADAQFIVDTGSFYDFISPAGAAQFKLPVGNAPFGLYVTGFGGGEIPQLATASTFAVAGFSVHNATFLVDNNDLGGGNVGLLGQNLFRIADMDFDFADGALHFVRPQHCGGQVLAYWAKAQPVTAIDLHWTSSQQPHLIGEVSMNGRDVEALFDTGTPRTILSLRAAKRAGITPDSPGVVPAGITWGTGKDLVKVWVAPVDKFEIGGETIQHTHVLIGDFNLYQMGADMLVGMDFFLAHHIYVAYSQNKMYLTYNGGRVFDLNEARSSQTASASRPGADGQQEAKPSPSGNPQQDATAQPAPLPKSGASAAAASQQSAAATANTPTDAAQYMRRGMAHIARHEYAEAIADLTHACDLDPTDVDCRYQRGMAYWYSHQGKPALADFNAAIQLQPDDFAAHLARAQFELKQHPADAQTDLDAVDRLAPQQADLRLTLADMYYSASAYAAAVHQYDLWTEYHGDDNRLSYALGNRCASEARADVDLDRALKDCNRSLRVMPKNAPDSDHASIICNRGMVYLRQGMLDSALADWDEALKLQPKLTEARYARGLVELKKGMTDQGQADLAAAKAQQPDIAKHFAIYGLKP